MKKLSDVFEASFQTVYAVHTAVRQRVPEGEQAFMSDDEIQAINRAFRQVNTAVEPGALPQLFVQQDVHLLDSFLEAAAEQARTGAGAMHATLHDEVC